jgi:hypothetical protein
MRDVHTHTYMYIILMVLEDEEVDLWLLFTQWVLIWCDNKNNG